MLMYFKHIFYAIQAIIQPNLFSFTVHKGNNPIYVEIVTQTVHKKIVQITFFLSCPVPPSPPLGIPCPTRLNAGYCAKKLQVFYTIEGKSRSAALTVFFLHTQHGSSVEDSLAYLKAGGVESSLKLYILPPSNLKKIIFCPKIFRPFTSSPLDIHSNSLNIIGTMILLPLSFFFTLYSLPQL